MRSNDDGRTPEGAPSALDFQLDVGGFAMRDGAGALIGYVFVEADPYAKREHWILLRSFRAPGIRNTRAQWLLEHTDAWESLEVFLEHAKGLGEGVGQYIVATCVETSLT